MKANGKLYCLVVGFVTLFVAGFCVFRVVRIRIESQRSGCLSFRDVLNKDPSSFDIAQINLICAEGLPGAERLDVRGSLEEIDRMVMRVKEETSRHFYRFRQNPTEFENSEGFFRMLILAVVLTEDFKVHYAPGKIGTIADAKINDGFFSNAKDVFLSGLTSDDPKGTCSSLPVLQVAVGRRLGYPLKLVATKGHLFLRWEDAKERFNIEAAGNGVNRFSDDYYRHWPTEISDEEILCEQYLKSFSPNDELAAFLSIRAACLREAKQFAQSAECYRMAIRFAPDAQRYRVLASEAEKLLTVR